MWNRIKIIGTIENISGTPSVNAPIVDIVIKIKSNKNQTSAKGNSGLNIPSKTKQHLFGFPCHRIFSSLQPKF